MKHIHDVSTFWKFVNYVWINHWCICYRITVHNSPRKVLLYVIAISTSLETFEILNLMFCLFGECFFCYVLISNSVSSRQFVYFYDTGSSQGKKTGRWTTWPQLTNTFCIWKPFSERCLVYAIHVITPKKFNACNKFDIKQK